MNLITKCRMEQDLSLRGLCRLSGVSLSTLINIEKGKSKASALTLAKLSRALQINYDLLAEQLLDTTPAERGSKGGKSTAAKRKTTQ